MTGGTAGEAAQPPAAGRPALSLGDPLSDRAVEDTPEAWGERGESEDDREARYRHDRPPHHGT